MASKRPSSVGIGILTALLTLPSPIRQIEVVTSRPVSRSKKRKMLRRNLVSVKRYEGENSKGNVPGFSQDSETIVFI